MRLLLLFVDREIAGALFFELLLEPRHQQVDLHVQIFVFFGGAGDDEWRARFVDEDGVHFIDDGERQAALHTIVEAEREVVAQVVETEFVVGAVGDVAAVRRALLVRILLVLDDTDREAEEAVDRTHPVRVALCQVFVHGDDVHAVARERVEVRGERRHQRLAFAGAHLGDAALVQCESADELHVEVAHLERAARGLADHRETFRCEVCERRPFGQPFAEFDGLGRERLVAQSLQFGLEGQRLAHRHFIAFDDAIVATAKEPRQKIEHLRILARNFKPDSHLE